MLTHKVFSLFQVTYSHGNNATGSESWDSLCVGNDLPGCVKSATDVQRNKGAV